MVSSRLVAQPDCVLKKDQDSIKVYACKITQQSFKSIEADFILNASLAEFAEVIVDAERYTDWQFRTVSAKVLSRLSDHEMIYYIVVSAPWPISDRDLVVHFLMTQDQTTKTISITANSQPAYLPAVAGLVRVPASTSRWTVTPLAPRKLAIHYEIQIDPGGAVPAWMANMVADQAPWESFRNLKVRMKTLRQKSAVRNSAGN